MEGQPPVIITFVVHKETTASSAVLAAVSGRPGKGVSSRLFFRALLESLSTRLLCYTSASTPTACVAQAASLLTAHHVSV